MVDGWVTLVLDWANSVVMSSTTFATTSRRSTISANVSLPQANIAPSSLTQCFLNFSH